MPKKVGATLVALCAAAMTIVASPGIASAADTSTTPTSKTSSDRGTEVDGPGMLSVAEHMRWNIYRVDFDFYVKDTAADGDHAEARVQELTADGRLHWFPWHKAIGNGAVNRFSTYVHDDAGVQAIRVEGCRRGDDLPDYCLVSSWAYQY